MLVDKGESSETIFLITQFHEKRTKMKIINYVKENNDGNDIGRVLIKELVSYWFFYYYDNNDMGGNENRNLQGLDTNLT